MVNATGPSHSVAALGAVLADRRVVLCLGSGGVGKTTTAAALAMALARRGERVVVLTIDPARRLADALGVGGTLSSSPSKVAEYQVEDTADYQAEDTAEYHAEDTADPAGVDAGSGVGEVWAAMLDPAETFRRVVEAEAPSPERAERILTNRLFVNLTTTLSGTNEYMAAERLHQLHGDDRFDRIVVDTPPSRHVLDFLDSPGRLTRFVDHRLYRSVLAPRHGLLRPLNMGAQAVMRLLGRLVGSSLVDDVVVFFAEFEGLDQGFRRRAAEIDAILSGGETAYLLVTTPRADRLAEADWIVDNLERRGRRLDGLVVNRILRFDAEDGLADREDGLADRAAVDRAVAVDSSDLAAALQENLEQLETLAEQQRVLVGPLIARVTSDRTDRTDRSAGTGVAGVALIELPEQRVPVHDLSGLEGLADVFGRGM